MTEYLLNLHFPAQSRMTNKQQGNGQKTIQYLGFRGKKSNVFLEQEKVVDFQQVSEMDS